jgi:hypothetical protein
LYSIYAARDEAAYLIYAARYDAAYLRYAARNDAVYMIILYASRVGRCRELNIKSKSKKRACQKVASTHFAGLQGRLTNGYNIYTKYHIVHGTGTCVPP